MPSSHATPQPFVQSGQPLHEFLLSFWQRQIEAAEREIPDYRHPPLPLARIKKVMKSDPDVKMIAADAPILFCKACEIFIEEITSRAFIVADSNKRRTLSRSDISKALAKSDQFDFLIDIVPREDQFPGARSKKKAAVPDTDPPPAPAGPSMTNTETQELPKEEERDDQAQDEPIALQTTAGVDPGAIPSSAMIDHLQSILGMQPQGM